MRAGYFDTDVSSYTGSTVACPSIETHAEYYLSRQFFVAEKCTNLVDVDCNVEIPARDADDRVPCGIPNLRQSPPSRQGVADEVCRAW
jgi:hypothetical protein